MSKLMILLLLLLSSGLSACKSTINTTAGTSRGVPTEETIQIENSGPIDSTINIPETSTEDDLDSLSADLEITVVSQEILD